MKPNLTLLSRVLSQPWAIRQEALSLFAQLVLAAAPNGKAIDDRERQPGARAQAGYLPLSGEACWAAEDDCLPDLPDGITCLLVWGVLGRAWTAGEKYWFDAIEVDDITRAIAATPEGQTIVLWFRSPGGITTGIPETAAALRKMGTSRRLLAFSDDLCASAAYWLASQCERIDATPTAAVGSIGVYLAFYDYCAYLEQAGISLELFKAGKLKGLGLPGNPLDDGARAHLQAGVDEAYRQFTADVLRNRDLAVETMQGQTQDGKNASAANLVDGFFPSAADYFRALAKGKV